MEVKDLLKELRENNIDISLSGERLLVHSDSPEIPAFFLDKLRNNKEGIIRYLSKHQTGRVDALLIKKVPESSDYAVSTAQRRLWVLSRFEEASIAYNMPGAYEFNGALNLYVLESAFKALMVRHESLRTVFFENEEGELRQRILSANDAGFTLEVANVCDQHCDATAIKALVRAEAMKPFDLANGPVLRAKVFIVEEKKYLLTYAMHHLVSDGWSMDIIIKELLALYATLSNGRQPALPPLPIQYKDYTAWESEQLKDENLAFHRNYWLNQFSGELPVIDLPGEYARPRIRTFAGGKVTRKLDNKIAAGIKRVSQSRGCTLFMGLLAGVNALLYKYTGLQDLIVGTTTAGRPHVDLEDQVGLYVNTLALRTRFNENDNFNALLDAVKTVTVEAYEHQVYPFDNLVEELAIQPDLSRNALFDIFVLLENITTTNAGVDEASVGDTTLSAYTQVDDLISKFDLTFDFLEVKDGLQVSIEFNKDIYSRPFAERLIDHLALVFENVIAEPAHPLYAIQYLPATERVQILETFNDTRRDYPQDVSLVQLLEAAMQQTPEATAIVCGEQVVSYSELNERANRLAAYLFSEYQVKPGDLIGIRLPRTEWMIIAMLGVLKSGAAYVPIDPAYPQERIDYMVADSRCVLVIDEPELNKFIPIQERYTQHADSVPSPDDLAYVIYTSGSTGLPKGVMIPHKAVVAFLYWCKEEFGNSEFDVVYAATSICFDLSVFEIFFTLFSGKKIQLLNNALEIADKLNTTDKVLLNTVPGVVSALLEQPVDWDAVTVLNMAGEPIPPEFMDRLPVARMEIRNLYGPSEDTTYSTVCRMQPGWHQSIGRPITNTEIYILDKRDQLCGIGVAGEINISGHGLAQGYLNRRELTAEKFVNNPFKRGERMYRTGDLGYWLPNGEIAFIGRADNQVKVRGYRIELGEVEAALRRQLGVKDCVVVAIGTGADKTLCAYVVANGETDTQHIKTELSKILPGYMVPSHIVLLQRMPRTTSGKIDRKALPAPEATMAVYVAPADAVEEKLTGIWSELLNQPKESISTTHSFFELGGHSLKATRLVSRIYKEFGVKVPLAELFMAPVLSGLANYIRSHARTTPYESIPKAPAQPWYRLSPTQQRMYMLQQLNPGATGYNMSMLLPLEPNASLQKLQTVFNQLITRHESLRTSYVMQGDEPVQQIHDAIDFTITHHRINANELLALQTGFIQPFVLHQAPLLRAAYVEVNEGGKYLLTDMHHIITDGVSQNILEHEFAALYGGEVLEMPVLQYKDYAEWINTPEQQQKMQLQEAWWLKTFEGELPVCELPYDHKRAAERNFEGGAVHFVINGPHYLALQALCQSQVGSSRVDLQACKLEYSIVSPK